MELTESFIQPYYLIAISFLVALLTLDPIWILGAALAGLSIIIKYEQTEKTVPTLEIKRTVTGKRYQEADHIRVKFEVRNVGETTFRGEIYDTIPQSAQIWKGSNIHLVDIPPGKTEFFDYVISFRTRGEYRLGPVRSRWHSLGDLFQKVENYEILKDLLIIPVPDRVSKYNLPPSFLSILGGSFRSKMLGEGMSFAGVREYQRGDTMRRINWKQTAKNRKLFSNEFEISRASNFVIVIDLTEEEREVSNASVRAALGMASFLLSYRSKVSLMTIGEYVEVMPKRSGKRHLIEMTEHLTRAKSINKINNIDLFNNRLKEGANKIEGEKNEIVLFSSINSIEKTIRLTKHLQKKGNLTILTPSAGKHMNIDNPVYDFAINLMNLRIAIMSNFMLEKSIKIYEWIPGAPFEYSMAQWRIQHA